MTQFSVFLNFIFLSLSWCSYFEIYTFDFRKEVTERTQLLAHESVSLKPIDCDKVIKTTTTSKMGVFYSLRERLRNRVILVDVLAALFGMGAWLSVNGVYTQLPLLVFKLPEGWVLPSYMVILIQVYILSSLQLIIYHIS